jgi:hypothetical protein
MAYIVDFFKLVGVGLLVTAAFQDSAMAVILGVFGGLLSAAFGLFLDFCKGGRNGDICIQSDTCDYGRDRYYCPCLAQTGQAELNLPQKTLWAVPRSRLFHGRTHTRLNQL